MGTGNRGDGMGPSNHFDDFFGGPINGNGGSPNSGPIDFIPSGGLPN